MQNSIDETIKQLHTKTKILLKRNASEEEVIAELQKEGITLDYAALIIQNVQNDTHKRKEFWRHLIIGALIMVATVAANYFSYDRATPGSMYLVIWGTFVVGAVLVTRAFILYWK